MHRVCASILLIFMTIFVFANGELSDNIIRNRFPYAWNREYRSRPFDNLSQLQMKRGAAWQDMLWGKRRSD
uniref:X1.B2.2 n=1 Tax=Schmidtea mediterranea TaxID=79327 RepID=V9XMQ5_SCHMD|nr:X1.B2.2 [Schmidtea mediterranea]